MIPNMYPAGVPVSLVGTLMGSNVTLSGSIQPAPKTAGEFWAAFAAASLAGYLQRGETAIYTTPELAVKACGVADAMMAEMRARGYNW